MLVRLAGGFGDSDPELLGPAAKAKGGLDAATARLVSAARNAAEILASADRPAPAARDASDELLAAVLAVELAGRAAGSGEAAAVPQPGPARAGAPASALTPAREARRPAYVSSARDRAEARAHGVDGRVAARQVFSPGNVRRAGAGGLVAHGPVRAVAPPPVPPAGSAAEHRRGRSSASSDDGPSPPSAASTDSSFGFSEEGSVAGFTTRLALPPSSGLAALVPEPQAQGGRAASFGFGAVLASPAPGTAPSAVHWHPSGLEIAATMPGSASVSAWRLARTSTVVTGGTPRSKLAAIVPSPPYRTVRVPHAAPSPASPHPLVAAAFVESPVVAAACTSLGHGPCSLLAAASCDTHRLSLAAWATGQAVADPGPRDTAPGAAAPTAPDGGTDADAPVFVAHAPFSRAGDPADAALALVPFSRYDPESSLAWRGAFAGPPPPPVPSEDCHGALADSQTLACVTRRGRVAAWHLAASGAVHLASSFSAADLLLAHLGADPARCRVDVTACCAVSGESATVALAALVSTAAPAPGAPPVLHQSYLLRVGIGGDEASFAKPLRVACVPTALSAHSGRDLLLVGLRRSAPSPDPAVLAINTRTWTPVAVGPSDGTHATALPGASAWASAPAFDAVGQLSAVATAAPAAAAGAAPAARTLRVQLWGIGKGLESAPDASALVVARDTAPPRSDDASAPPAGPVVSISPSTYAVAVVAPSAAAAAILVLLPPKSLVPKPDARTGRGMRTGSLSSAASAAAARAKRQSSAAKARQRQVIQAAQGASSVAPGGPVRPTTGGSGSPGRERSPPAVKARPESARVALSGARAGGPSAPDHQSPHFRGGDASEARALAEAVGTEAHALAPAGEPVATAPARPGSMRWGGTLGRTAGGTRRKPRSMRSLAGRASKEEQLAAMAARDREHKAEG